jgi:CheY-like chemotaxis protein
MTTASESILPLATAADQTLIVELPPAAVRVDGDGARLVQVFANVLNNAVKFTPPGGRIWFTAEPQANEVVVRVRDTGTGIDAETLPRVFDMFEQAEPILDRSTGGLGIGLTLARRLVEMHEGRIDVRSPGHDQGTEVEIRLPTTAVQVAKTERVDSLTTAARKSILRVLIVDDNPDAAEMLDMAVAHLGHTTRLAHDGGTAVKAATEFLPDVILLDVGLPGMNGYAVARTLRAQPGFDRVHIAAVTGWGQEEDRRKAREAGFDSHFTKPLSPDALEQLLASIEPGLPANRDTISASRTRPADSGRAS